MHDATKLDQISKPGVAQLATPVAAAVAKSAGAGSTTPPQARSLRSTSTTLRWWSKTTSVMTNTSTTAAIAYCAAALAGCGVPCGSVLAAAEAANGPVVLKILREFSSAHRQATMWKTNAECTIKVKYHKASISNHASRRSRGKQAVGSKPTSSTARTSQRCAACARATVCCCTQTAQDYRRPERDGASIDSLILFPCGTSVVCRATSM
jgi:hypothetical protein